MRSAYSNDISIQMAKPKQKLGQVYLENEISLKIEKAGTPSFSKLPDVIRQQTAQEIRNAAIALADGAVLNNWSEVEGEIALRHCLNGQPIETKITAGHSFNWGGEQPSYYLLKQELKELTTQSVLLFQILLEAVLLNQYAVMKLDDLINELGENPRSTEERKTLRNAIYRQICLFSHLTSHGKRYGLYQINPQSRKKEEISIDSHYFAITDRIYHQRGKVNPPNNTVPLGVVLTASLWIDSYRNNQKILTNLGNIRLLTGLPIRQAHGEWALSIGLTLNQLWRERARFAELKRNGEKNQPTIVYNRPFTRFELLSMFSPVRFVVEEILYSKNPLRAQQHWNKTIRELKKRGFISHYEELSNKQLPRKGWQGTWLYEEQLDIRPGSTAKENAIAISKAASKRSKSNRARKMAA